MPHALGLRAPVVIAAHGIRHTVLSWLDPAQALRLEHAEAAIPATEGTRVTLPFPLDEACDPLTYWAQAFAVFNPHALVKISEVQGGLEHAQTAPTNSGNFYRPTVELGRDWRKYLPGDATSAWWYGVQDLERLIFSHIAEARRGGPDLLLRDFVKQFRNLSGNAKAKNVCAALPDIARLSDFEGREAAVATLLAAMRAAGAAPSVDILGAIGAAHFRACFAAWYGVKRSWYHKTKSLVDGIPTVVEVAIAETVQPGLLWHGVNFSPTFEIR